MLNGVRTLWGYRCDDGCSSCGEVECGCDAGPACGPSCGGCDSCDATCGIDAATCGTEGYVMESNMPPGGDSVVRIIKDPSPSQGIIQLHPPLRPYPQDVKKIFTPRSEVAEGTSVTREY